MSDKIWHSNYDKPKDGRRIECKVYYRKINLHEIVAGFYGDGKMQKIEGCPWSPNDDWWEVVIQWRLA